MGVVVGKRHVCLRETRSPKKRSDDIAQLIRLRSSVDAILCRLEFRDCYVCGACLVKAKKKRKNQVLANHGGRSLKNLIKERGEEEGRRQHADTIRRMKDAEAAITPPETPIVQIPGKTIFAGTCSM